MNFRTRFYKPALALLALLLFCGVSRIQDALNHDRADLGLAQLSPLENAPPVLAFTTVALGGFRGLIANALWIRAAELQEDDKMFEMVQLADWITKLEPHFVQVWLMQGWNMAYNISVKFKDPEDRWRWVQRGISLLRDDGLRYNPRETLIYRELSWFFQHKMGQNLDDAQFTYKLRWAQQMEDVLGGRPNFAALINPQTPEDRERARRLREVYKMDPKIVQEVDQLYGPLDWRLPDAHAIYWAELGRRYAKPKDQETLRRSIYQTMQQACLRNGALPIHVQKVTAQNFILEPNLDLVPTVSAAYEKMIAEEPNLKQNMGNAHKNFLKDATYLLFADNRSKQAQYWFDYMRNKYPNAVPPGQTLEQYAIEQITTDVKETDMNKITALLQSMARTEFIWLSVGEDEKAENYDAFAQRVWEHYQAKIKGAEQRVGLRPLAVLRKEVLDRMLEPNNGWLSPESILVLRTKLNLPPPTNAPPPAVAQ